MGHQTRAASSTNLLSILVDNMTVTPSPQGVAGTFSGSCTLYGRIFEGPRPPYHENNILGSRPAFPIAMRSNNGTPGRWNRLAASTHVDVDAHADVEHAGQLVD